MSLKVKTKKKGGCSTPADVNASYMLIDNPPTTTKGGSLKKKRGGCSTPADVNDSYMLNDLINKTTTTTTTTKGGSLRRRRGGNCSLYADVNKSYMLDSQTPPTTTKGGSFDLANQTASLISKTQEILKSQGGCGCSVRKGGSVELAPFAAAVTLLAARYFTDEQLMKSNPFMNFVSSSKSKSRKHRNG